MSRHRAEQARSFDPKATLKTISKAAGLLALGAAAIYLLPKASSQDQDPAFAIPGHITNAVNSAVILNNSPLYAEPQTQQTALSIATHNITVLAADSPIRMAQGDGNWYGFAADVLGITSDSDNVVWVSTIDVQAQFIKQ